MRDVTELLRAKEQELVKVKRQVEALRVAAPLLGADDEEPLETVGMHVAAKGTRLESR